MAFKTYKEIQETKETKEPKETLKKFQPAVCKVGNIGKIEEIRESKAGNLILSFSLAVRIPSSDGNWDNAVTRWYEVTVVGDRVIALNDVLRVGNRVMVYGLPSKDEWEDKHGTVRTTYRILADAVGFELRFGLPRQFVDITQIDQNVEEEVVSNVSSEDKGYEEEF